MKNDIYVELTQDSIDINKAIRYVGGPDHGAVDVFIGMVRNQHNGRNVTGITYDAHKILCENGMETICTEAKMRWPGSRYYVLHYKGYLPVMGVSIVIAASAAHRADSFDAARYVIEEIKKRLPVWKQEHYEDGEDVWLPGCSLAIGTENNDHIVLKCVGA